MSEQLDIDLARVGDYTIDDVVAWVGTNDQRRLQAFDAEQARGDEARGTLIKRLAPKPATGTFLAAGDHPFVTASGGSFAPGDVISGDVLDLESDHDQHLLADGQIIDTKESR